MARIIQRPSVLRNTASQPQKPARGLHLPRKVVPIAYGAIILLLGLVGLLVQDVTVGRILLVLYGIVAVAVKIPSSDTFKMAIVSMVSIIILAFLDNATLIKNFAEYTFLLLAIGVICTAIEVRRSTSFRRQA